MSKLEKAIKAEVDRIWLANRTYGDLERAAGVLDRNEFWKDKPTEDEGRIALRKLIEQRVREQLAG